MKPEFRYSLKTIKDMGGIKILCYKDIRYTTYTTYKILKNNNPSQDDTNIPESIQIVYTKPYNLND